MAADRAERLQKVLGNLGLASRREVEEWIRAGRLTVNGEAAALGTRVRATDQIRLDGRLVRSKPVVAQQVLICHRSPGERLDGPEGGDRPALLERVPRAAGRRFVAVSPMPLNDGGLELVTSDGELAARLQRGVRALESEYRVRLRGELDEGQIRKLREGAVEGGPRVEVLDCTPRGGEGSNRWYALTLRGASGRDARRLFEQAGAVVSRVLRTRLGPVALERTLPRGRFRKLTPPEIDALRAPEPTTGRRSSPP